MASLELIYDVKCDCGDDLDIDEREKQGSFGTQKILYITPCKDCVAAAKQEGYDERVTEEKE